MIIIAYKIDVTVSTNSSLYFIAENVEIRTKINISVILFATLAYAEYGENKILKTITNVSNREKSMNKI